MMNGSNLVRDADMWKHRFCAWLLVIVVSAIGCGRSGPQVELVVGKVLLDGKPVENATVGFAPVTPGAGLPAAGTTDGQGVFRLTTFGGGKAEKGAAVGDYIVTVTKTEAIGEYPTYVEGGPVPPPFNPKLRYVVPRAYAESATSGLRATVKRGLNGGVSAMSGTAWCPARRRRGS
jgi:hypothetical protein